MSSTVVVNFFRVVLPYFGTLGKSYCNALLEILGPDSGSQLSRDLKKLFAMNRTLTLIIAEGDPGREVLMANARQTVSTALKTNRIQLQIIMGADHTFTRSRARRELIYYLSAILTRQYGQVANCTNTPERASRTDPVHFPLLD